MGGRIKVDLEVDERKSHACVILQARSSRSRSSIQGEEGKSKGMVTSCKDQRHLHAKASAYVGGFTHPVHTRESKRLIPVRCPCSTQHNDHTDGDAWGHVVLFGSLSYLSSLVSLPWWSPACVSVCAPLKSNSSALCHSKFFFLRVLPFKVLRAFIWACMNEKLELLHGQIFLSQLAFAHV